MLVKLGGEKPQYINPDAVKLLRYRPVREEETVGKHTIPMKPEFYLLILDNNAVEELTPEEVAPLLAHLETVSKEGESAYNELEAACVAFINRQPRDGTAWTLSLQDAAKMYAITQIIKERNPDAFVEQSEAGKEKTE